MTTYSVRVDFANGTHYTLSGLSLNSAHVSALNTISCIQSGEAEFPSKPTRVTLQMVKVVTDGIVKGRTLEDVWYYDLSAGKARFVTDETGNVSIDDI